MTATNSDRSARFEVNDRTQLEFRERILRKNARTLVPILALAYVISYLDRSNVGFAGLSMRNAVGLSATQFGWGAGIFVIGYCAFAVPSNAGMYRFGARRWLALIMVVWGLAASATALTVGPRSFYVLRFLLGVAEAGFVPGVVFYLTIWFPTKYRTRVLAWFMVALPVSFFVGGPLSGYLVGIDAFFGLSGWQLMFIVEGIPASIVGILLFFTLKDNVADAEWLSDPERQELVHMLSQEKGDRANSSLIVALKDPRVLILTGISFGFTSGSNGIGIWLPQMLKDYRLTNVQIGLVSAIPYFFATVGMLIWAWYVDRTGRRIRNLTISCLMAGVAFAASLFFTSLAASLLMLSVALVGISSARAIFFTIPQRFLSGAAMASGLAFMNAVASIGGFVGPFIVGWLKDATGTFISGMIAMAGMLILATALSTCLSFFATESS
jgi:MFS transporter, ACS family, tartrate transporter